MKPVVIRVSDNGKLRVVELNGKTIKSGTKVSRKGKVVSAYGVS